jgi:hypothetical protein
MVGGEEEEEQRSKGTIIQQHPSRAEAAADGRI